MNPENYHENSRSPTCTNCSNILKNCIPMIICIYTYNTWVMKVCNLSYLNVVCMVLVNEFCDADKAAEKSFCQNTNTFLNPIISFLVCLLHNISFSFLVLFSFLHSFIFLSVFIYFFLRYIFYLFYIFLLFFSSNYYLYLTFFLPFHDLDFLRNVL